MAGSASGARRARMLLILAVVGGFVLVGLLQSGAHASHSSGSYKYGRAWTKPRIKYFNKAKVWNWSVKQGARAWNQSGIRPRFVRVSSKSKADVIVMVKELPSDVSGRATVGMPYRGKAKVWLQPPRMMDELNGKFDMAHTTTHEFGHVLGLDHEPKRCSAMNSESTGFGRCELPRTGMWRCRLIEAADIERALHLYRGSPAPLKNPAECYKWQIPPPATEFSATESGGLVELRWRNPSTKGFWTAKVNRRAGSCPTGPEDPQATFVTNLSIDWGSEVSPGGVSTANDFLSGSGSGSYCYAVWVGEEARRFNPQGSTTVLEYSDPFSTEPDPDPSDPVRVSVSSS